MALRQLSISFLRVRLSKFHTRNGRATDKSLPNLQPMAAQIECLLVSKRLNVLRAPRKVHSSMARSGALASEIGWKTEHIDPKVRRPG